MADFDIDAGAYQRFSQAHGFSPRCPFCGSIHWSFTRENNGKSYGLVITSRRAPNIDDLELAKVLMLTCSTCHYVATVLRDPVQKWLSENPA